MEIIIVPFREVVVVLVALFHQTLPCPAGLTHQPWLTHQCWLTQPVRLTHHNQHRITNQQSSTAKISLIINLAFDVEIQNIEIQIAFTYYSAFWRGFGSPRKVA